MKKTIFILTLIVSLYVNTSLSSSSLGSSSGDYNVVPPDNNPSIGYDDGSNSLVSLMKSLTSQGYTSIWYNGLGWSDHTLYGKSKSYYTGKTLGYCRGDTFIPSKYKNKAEASNLITKGVYKLNKNTIAQHIVNGKFFNRVLLDRLLVEEFLFAQLIVSASPFCLKTNWLNTNTLLSGEVTKWQAALKQIRFVRNGLEDKGTSGTFTLGKSPTFSPIDFFVGIILINNSSVVFKSGTTGILSGGVGFFPIPSSSLMNKWASAYTDDSTGLPTREPMEFGELGSSNHSFSLQSFSNENILQINLAGIQYRPNTNSSGASSSSNSKEQVRYFSAKMMQEFFQDRAPWALIVEAKDNQSPQVEGIAQMNFADFGKYLKIDTQNTGSFSLEDIFTLPFTSYQSCYVKGPDSTVQRSNITSSYPIRTWIAQSLFNGVLESSIYQNMADSKTNNASIFPDVALNERRPAPSQAQILGYGSGHDWLFLRSLIITKVLLHMKGISLDLINAKNEQGQSLFLQALNQPTKNISYNGERIYIGSKGSNFYFPIIKVLPSKKSKIPVQATISQSTPKPLPKSTGTGLTSSGSALKGSSTSQLSSSQSTPKPLPKSTGTGTAQVGSSIKRGGLSTMRSQIKSSKAVIKAYKKGYRAGQSVEAYKHGYKTGKLVEAYKKGYLKGIHSSNGNKE